MATNGVISTTFIDQLGSDVTVVNAARVSFDKQVTKMRQSDEKLLAYLAKHKHYSPFRHPHISVVIEAPEFVMRQLYKHIVGIGITCLDYNEKDHAWNEMSGRYVIYDNGGFYGFNNFRMQSSDNKQGSEGFLPPELNERAKLIYEQSIKENYERYKQLVDLGVAKEQARSILPFSTMTKVYWTASIQAIFNFLELRLASDAQEEIQQVAKQLEQIVKGTFPITYKAWLSRND